MSVDHNGKIYIPTQSPPSTHPARSNSAANSSMQLDDTKDRVYIHNLDDEISDIESEEERLVFLPDIEKKLAKLPKSVLLGEGHPHIGNELVLYNVPSSLTVPAEEDKVRKAVIESRVRAREKQARDAAAMRGIRPGHGVQVNGVGESRTVNGLQNMGHVIGSEVTDNDEDGDPMDLG